MIAKEMNSPANDMEALDASVIRSEFMPETNDICGVLIIHESLDSTNRWLLDQLRQGRLDKGDVCLAESQTAGRGRQGKSWVSPANGGLYFSIAWSEQHDGGNIEAEACLPLAVAVAVADVLDELEVKDVKIKWPNDVLVGDRKICGILVERIAGRTKNHWVIGVGLNLADACLQYDSSALMATSLDKYMPDCLGHRNRIVAMLIESILESCSILFVRGASAILPRWERMDFLKGKTVTVRKWNEVVLSGTVQGISDRGKLMMKTDAGVELIDSGEVSVRF